MKKEKGTKKPKYMVLYDRLRQNIIDGVYKSGDRLPSKRVLADRYSVSVITAERVYELLIAEGYVTAREKSGYFCEYTGDDRFLSSVASGETIPEKVDYGNISFPFSLYAKTVRKVLSDYGESIFSKGGGTGTDVLRKELAAYLMRSRGISTSPDCIVVGAGAEYLYGLIVELLGRDKIYAAEDPSYEKIEQVYKAMGAGCEMLPLGSSGIKSAALKKTGAQVLHITPYRSFPSGVTASASKRLEYIIWSKQKNRYIIEDDFESEFTVTGKIYDTVYSLSPCDNVIYINTFSRTISPSVRTAFMVLPERLMERFKENLGFYSCTVPTLEQYALAQLLSSGEFERHINRRRRELRLKQKAKGGNSNV